VEEEYFRAEVQTDRTDKVALIIMLQSVAAPTTTNLMH
jgi:hypothetical protein